MMPLEPSSFALGAHTLPRNFTFHYQDGELPRTPEPSDRPYPQRTSPPPIAVARVMREPYRLRRRRAPLQACQRAIRAFAEDHAPQVLDDPFSDAQDIPLPSIELTDAAGQSASLEQQQQQAAEHNPIAPPKTPVGQIYESAELAREGSSSQEDLTRPSTACSGFSNSSASSSIESFPSFCGASPKIEPDPFLATGVTFIASPFPEFKFQAPGTTTRNPPRKTWTKDMDDHLWLTYMRYLQDPTHTPFKMLPGTAPPPGVCSRVVKEAKKTWRGSQTSAVPPVHRFARWGSQRAGSLDLPSESRHDGLEDRRSFAPWPRSDSLSRKRLRDLCKLKPTLSAHYGRLLHARSPTPFLSSTSSSSVPRDLPSMQPSMSANSFSVRDMNISLATSTATTMQPDHPIVQLGTEPISDTVLAATTDSSASTLTPRPRAVTHHTSSHAPRTPSHHKSHSVQVGSSMNNFRPLASPFKPAHSFNASASERFHSLLQTVVDDNSVATTRGEPSLAAPAELHAPAPRRSLFKRPAQSQLEDMMNSEDPYTRQTHLMRELFGTQPVEVSHRRVRSRGFSLGDMAGSSRLENLFAAPAPAQNPAPATASVEPTVLRPSTLLPSASLDRVTRLGSPFVEKPATKMHFNTFPRNFSLIGLEPAMDIAEDQFEDLSNEPPNYSSEHS